MQIEAEKQRVSAKFREQKHIRLLGNKSWVLPLQLVEIQMKTVVRSQMDVLMKMILKILARLEVKQGKEISELLAVETIFVEHMLDLMMRNKMVGKIGDTFQLTNSGLEHLEQGTFEHDPMVEQVEITYSSYHNGSMNRDPEQTGLEGDLNLSEFQFAEDVELNDVTQLSDSHIKEMIQKSGYEFLVEKGQKVIEEIDLVEIKESMRAVCIEFHLHDRAEDMVYIRVWNTWTGKFDSQLEDELNQREAVSLRELYNI